METQGPLAVQDQPHGSLSVDLNRATADELSTLPGIGAALAERIIIYREGHGPFTDTMELTSVSGIGPVVLERIADRVTAMPGTQAEPAVVGDDGSVRSAAMEIDYGAPTREERALPEWHVEPEPSEEVPAMIADELSGIGEEPSPEEPELPVEVVASPSLAVQAPALEPEASQYEPEPEREEMSEPEPEVALEPPPAPVTPERRNWTWLWSSLLGAALGGLLGLLLALLIFAGINGSIDVRRSSAFRSLSSQAAGLSVEIDAVRTDVSTLQGDIDGLRQRVEVLSGLTARMEQAESTIETFGDDIDTLQTSMSALTQDVDDLGQAVDTLKLQSAQTMSFFEQLRALLEELFGGKEPQGAIPNPEGVN